MRSLCRDFSGNFSVSTRTNPRSTASCDGFPRLGLAIGDFPVENQEQQKSNFQSLGLFDDVDNDNETMNATKELDDSSESQSSSENEDHLIEVKANSKSSKEDNDEKYSVG